MIRIAIVEDKDSEARILSGYIQQYAEESGEEFEVKWYQDGEDILEDYKPVYDIIFLDIEMRWMDGMTTAEEIRKVDKEVILIFVTNIAQYAIKGYAVDALNYLLKPLPYFAFSLQMKRTLQKLRQRIQNYITLSLASGAVRLNINDIIFVESDRHIMTFHTSNGEIEYKGTMKDLENKLESLGFFRCNHCYLVNLRYVRSIEGNTTLVGGYELAVSRARKKPFLEALTSYVGLHL